MITAAKFDEFVDAQTLIYGPEPPLRAPNEGKLLEDMLLLVIDYHDPPEKKDIEKIMRLQAVCAACERYLEDARLGGGGYAGRVAAVLETVRSAKADIRQLKHGARTAAKANWLKVMPKKTADAVKSAKAAQNWDNLKKIHNSQGGKKINDHYWKEVFDPRHRPPHSVGGYDARFAEWLNMVTPFQADGVTPNPGYDPDFHRNFFSYLDGKGGIPVGYEYKYLSRAERETFQVVVKGGLLARKRAEQLFDTTGWELNNGLRNGDYPDSSQSMLTDHGIWVISPEGAIYSGPQTSRAVDMHHSAFLAGAAIKGGGEWLVQGGRLKVITGSSGHYTPNFAQFQDALRTLANAGVDLGTVAAEWNYQTDDNFHYFNAKQLAIAGVKAEWHQWPKFVGQPLQPVQALNPRTVRAMPTSVGGTPYPAPGGPAAATGYTAPPRQPLNRTWPPPKP